MTADNKGFLIEAIMTVVEQKVLSKLIEGEQVENSDIRLINAAANLARATVFRQRRADEARERAEGSEGAGLVRGSLQRHTQYLARHRPFPGRAGNGASSHSPRGHRKRTLPRTQQPARPTGFPAPEETDGQTEGSLSDESAAKPTESQPVEEDRARTEHEATQLKTCQATLIGSDGWSAPKLVISQGEEQSGLRTRPSPTPKCMRAAAAPRFGIRPWVSAGSRG